MSCWKPYWLMVILFVAWLLGLVSFSTMRGFIHVLPVVALVVMLVSHIQGDRINRRWWTTSSTTS